MYFFPLKLRVSLDQWIPNLPIHLNVLKYRFLGPSPAPLSQNFQGIGPVNHRSLFVVVVVLTSSPNGSQTPKGTKWQLVNSMAFMVPSSCKRL